jgi:drug/metabolite transporter (DMT)-like permease
VFGSVLAVVLLGERFELFHAVGYGLAFTGITVATKKSSAVAPSVGAQADETQS